VIASSKDGATFSPKSDWINLPVGYNLMDHLNTDLIITHPDVVFYDFYQAWDSPIPADENSYLKNRTGILAQAAPNIGPMVGNAGHLTPTRTPHGQLLTAIQMWDQVTPSDGIVRQLQWTCRVEGDSHYTNSTRKPRTPPSPTCALHIN
jgi:cellobiose dehydrogenase (acceptor)